MLADDLYRLGLRPGDRVVVHSSLKAIGPIDGGAETVIRALLDVIGPGGLLVVPTFTYFTVRFDPTSEPGLTGRIPETLRSWPGAVRSWHPTHSVAAIGAGAAALCAGHHLVGGLALDSPLDRLAAQDGYVLLLGVGHVVDSTVHIGEAHLPVPYLGVPFQPDQPRRASVLLDGEEIAVPLRHPPGCSRAFGAVERPLRRRGGRPRRPRRSRPGPARSRARRDRGDGCAAPRGPDGAPVYRSALLSLHGGAPMSGNTVNADVHERVFAVVDARREEIVSLVADLVRFPSVNRRPYGDELACQQFVAATLRGMGLAVDVFRPDEVPEIEAHPGWWPGPDYTDRPNVVGVRRGTGSARGLLLLAHVDVVPEGPHELWRYGPFNPTVEDGALVGRGSNDDKGGLAAAIMALACVEAAGYRPRGDVIVASAVDEESAGANGTLAVLLRPHTADAAVYCDGLDLDVHTANLGGVNVEIELQVRPERAGTTIARIMEIVSAFYEDLQRFAAERRSKLAADPRYAETVWPDYAVRTGFLQAGSEDGGNPGAARIHTSAYVLPGEEIATVQDEIAQRVHAVAARFDDLLPPRIAWVGRIMPPSAVPDDLPFVDAVAAAYERASGQPARRRGMPMSDLFQFNLHSPRPLPTVAMGPGRWGEGGAHQANESVLIDAHLIPFVKTLAGLIVDWCGVE